MNEDLDKIISDFNYKAKKHQKKFKNYLKIVQEKGNSFFDYSKIKLEINKCKFELRKEYMLLGKYVSNKYDSDNIIDFTYDENYKELLDNLKTLKLYVLKLEENI